MKKFLTAIVMICLFAVLWKTDSYAITKVTQTKMESTSATVTWQKEADEKSFKIYIWMPEEEWDGNKLITTYTNYYLGEVSDVTYTFQGLKPGKTYDYIIWALDIDGDPLRDIEGTVKTKPAKIEGLNLKLKWSSYYELGSKTKMEYNLYVDFIAQSSAEGYEIRLYNAKGKQVKKVNASVDESSIRRYTFKNLKESGYRVKVRAYNTFNGRKYYGAWSSQDYAFRQPASAAMYSNGLLYIKWEKTPQVTGYDIYVNSKKGGTYTKVKSVGKNTHMISVKKLNGKAFKKNKTYYYYVVAKKKVGKKLYTSVLSRKFKVKITS